MGTILKVESLEKRYGEIIAVNSISFEVHRGEIFGFLGPNGAGKTTSIKMMSGLLKPDRGNVIINGEYSNSLIGVCPQNVVIWENLTCIEQIVYMGQMYNMTAWESKKRAKELLESLGLIDNKNMLAKTLSGGMQRRLNLALSLIHSPAIVFLDEPQVGLDPQSRVLVRDYIRSIKKNTTVILTTHDMEEAEKLSDRICIIDKGQILAIGTAEEIKKISGQEDVIEIEIMGIIQRELIPYLNIETGDYNLISGNSAYIKINNPYSTLENILGVVRARNIKVNDLRLRKKSLEDVFINITGRSLKQ
ncbi:MAG: ATP-binding cassette domain-containing protein [Spirochaetaceae bacterium]|nr:ATP-binding cassette domain-containing protein [Spirochaetaceae bacterium]